ncbi:MAG: hypothetical protein D6744_13250 [Planctomycetota bacterium]|nr:MAG: hypothetical protein D6744_13250 [Planctomycetota bacterium]
MRLALLCGSSARSMYVANVLAATHDLACIVSEVGRDWSRARIRRNLRPRVFWSRFARACSPSRRRRRATEASILFGRQRPHWPSDVSLFRVRNVNDASVVTTLGECGVGGVAVFGTSLLRRAEFFSLRAAILNLHGGISPEYRGADGVFWAVHSQDWENIGGTVHFVTPRIDGGALVARYRPALKGGQSEAELVCAVLRGGAHLLSEAFARLERGEAFGVEQPHRGRLFQAHHRTRDAERRVRRVLADSTAQAIELPERVEWFVATKTVQRGSEAVEREVLACR